MSSDVLVGRFSIDELIKAGAISAHKDGNFGSLYPRIDDFVDDGIPLLTAKVVNAGRIDFGAAQRLSKEKAAKLPYGFIQADDVLLSHNATVGRVAVVPKFNGQAMIGTSLTYFRLDKSRLLPRYLACFFESRDFQNQLASIMGLSTRNQVPITAQRLLAVEVPPLAVQRELSAFVGAIDDRITLLRETNATLEAIAQALFKSWFVDFDPVRAKMQGRTPEGMNEATAALFPDALEESELGLVPRGWQVISVADVSSVIKGKSYSSKDLVTEHDTALVTLKSFERGGGFRLDGFKPYSGTYKQTQVVVPGDLIIAYTDVTQAAELIGKPAIVIGVSAHSTLVASLDVGIVRAIESKVSRQFLYGIFKADVFQAHTFSHTSGTTVLHLSKDGVGSYKFACPSFELVSAFSTVAETLAGRRQVNIDQMRTLTTLRDTLLPRLISGQLPLPEAKSVHPINP